jgi:NADH:quinone reductase (non-electrogenic)
MTQFIVFARVCLLVACMSGYSTAIELCAELSDFLWEDLIQAYPEVPLHQVRIVVLEGSSQILSMFERTLVSRAVHNLKRQGVELHTNSVVQKVTERHVELKDGQRIAYGCLIWAAGIGPTPLIDTLW